MPIDPRARRLLDMLAAAGGSSAAPPPSVEARRAALSQLADLAAGPSPPIAEVRDIPASGRTPPLRLYDPAPGEAQPGLLFMHGGGWTAGGLDTHDALCRTLATAGQLRIAAVDYRRAPEHPRPAAVQDALAALDWLGGRADRVGVAGDSAGAHIAAELALARRADLALQLLICPILDPAGALPSRTTFAEGHFINPTTFAFDRKAYFGDDPMSLLDRDDLAGLPPTLIEVAEFDPFRDEGLAYATRLACAGVPVRATPHPGMIHYFYALAGAIPAGRVVVTAIGRTAGEWLRAGSVDVSSRS